MPEEKTSLYRRIESGKRLLLAEIEPPCNGRPDALRDMVKRFSGKVHTLGISDNRDRVRMSALAAAALTAAQGVEPILHMITRDRNRIALVSDCLGAQALGIGNLLCTSGAHQTLGLYRAAKSVFDIDAIQLLQACGSLGSNGSLVGEKAVDGLGPWCLGAVAAPLADPVELQLMRLEKKIAAGAKFLITQPVFDFDRFAAWWKEIVGRGLDKKVAFVAGVEPLVDAEKAQQLAASRPSPGIAPAMLQRLSAAVGADAQRTAGVQIALDTIKKLAALDGLRGVQVCADGDAALVAEVIEKSGLGIDPIMPAKYSLHTAPVAPRLRSVGKLGVVDWREDCSSCHNCVKRGCVYGFYRDEADTLRDDAGYLDYIYQCKGCLNCIQDCTKNILTRVVNPEYERLGDDYFTPEIITTTWFQSETGRIPVSGSGYGGRFSGPGFDSMWTDMSEIVRPTRDGIHGREYINTSVDIGRKLAWLTLEDGRPTVAAPPLIETPLPVIFDRIAAPWNRGAVGASALKAAAKIATRAIVPAGEIEGALPAGSPAIPLVADAAEAARFAGVPLLAVEDRPDIAALAAELKKQSPERILMIRVAAGPALAQRVLELAQGGAEVIHLVFDAHGRETGVPRPRHCRDVLREVHRGLVKAGIRDEVTLVSSGGIALAEHVAKAIICGADLVAIDLPLIVAIECRLCGECAREGICPVELESIDAAYATARMVNLMGAWHQQLIEVLGAMGIREVRRLRGETGRAMFFEDLERESFGRLFGKRKDANGEPA